MFVIGDELLLRRKIGSASVFQDRKQQSVIMIFRAQFCPDVFRAGNQFDSKLKAWP